MAELAAGRPLYDSSVRNRDILKFYGDTNHDFHPGKLHKTMPELQGMSDAFHDFLDEVFLSSAERPFAVELLEHNIWLEGQVRRLVGVVWRVFPRLVSLACCVVLLAQQRCFIAIAGDVRRICGVVEWTRCAALVSLNKSSIAHRATPPLVHFNCY